jgi:hypothetical protein
MDHLDPLDTHCLNAIITLRKLIVRSTSIYLWRSSFIVDFVIDDLLNDQVRDCLYLERPHFLLTMMIV